ncbi:MAG: hypothetical protein Q9195_003018 [Heterodermia aff. obscurata]
MGDTEQPKPIAQYPLGRDLHASARLYLQHLFWNIRLGYLLHPSISVDLKPQIRVADIGTGNALWLLELSQDLPSDTQLVGYDISSAQFPNKESLPPQVHLEILDILSDELPKEVVGTFDVVHIRALVLVVQAGDPRTILSNSCALLKPGGYLQWDEADMSAFQSVLLNSQATNAASSRLVQHELQYLVNCGFKNEYVLLSTMKRQRLTPLLVLLKFVAPCFEIIGNKCSSWVKHLPEYFSSSSELELVAGSRLPKCSVSQKLETENHLMALEDFLPGIAVHVARVEEKVVPEIQDALDKTLKSAIEEASKGVALQMDWYTCVGRKV